LSVTSSEILRNAGTHIRQKLDSSVGTVTKLLAGRVLEYVTDFISFSSSPKRPEQALCPAEGPNQPGKEGSFPAG